MSQMMQSFVGGGPATQNPTANHQQQDTQNTGQGGTADGTNALAGMVRAGEAV